ncbi:MAG: aminoglycoside phosphotransferase (APT) family kinase protein [Glaciecola sp.]
MSDTSALLDAEQTRAGCQRWLGPTAEIVGFTSPPSTGYSCETYVLDVDRAGRITREILRTAPPGKTLFGGYDLEVQVNCMRALAELIPTPSILAYESDPSFIGRPFYVMAAVEGRTPDENPPYTMFGWVKDAPFATQALLYTEAIDVIARLGSTRPADVGLQDSLDRPELGDTGLDQQLARWRELDQWGRQGTEQPTLDAAWSWLDEHRPTDPGRDRILWGDARVSNMIFGDDGRVRAVLDWEMAGHGPAEIDLAWLLWMDRQFTVVFDTPRLEGFPGEPALIQRWADSIGHLPTDLDWFLVFAGVRFSIIQMRVAILSKQDGHLPVDSDVERNHLGTRLLAKTLGLPSPGPVGFMG